MLIYNYDKETKCYIYESEAHLDPLESKKQSKNVYLIPSNCTIQHPPLFNENEIPVWNIDNWEIKKDFRGETVYSKTNKSAVIVDYIGNINSEYTRKKPTSIWDEWDEDENKWIENLLKKTQNELKMKRERKIFLKSKIMAGEALGINMSEEITELNNIV